MKIGVKSIIIFVSFLLIIPITSIHALQQQKDDLPFTYKLNNGPPNKPSLWGEVDCETGIMYSYYARTTDPDNDRIRYAFDFGDGCAHTIACCFESGETCETFHCWENTGTYSVTVIAMDEHGACSEPSDPLGVSVPENFDTSFQFYFELILERLLHIIGV